ncbi:hypothetical protein DENSPDRAFT_511432 [Dentipellis sp. KUC8613]|nr:hypothetical protein DENSPDRAFT_511432 [Dentipellis sp. KUC8613]
MYTLFRYPIFELRFLDCLNTLLKLWRLEVCVCRRHVPRASGNIPNTRRLGGAHKIVTGEPRPSKHLFSRLVTYMASTETANTAQLLAERKQARAARAQVRRQRAEAHKVEGNKKFQEGRYEEAMECYHDAIVVNGPQPHILSNIAATYLKMGDYRRAEGTACYALMHDPLFIKARYRRAIARKGLKKYEKAISDLVWILQQDPSLTEAKNELNALRALCTTGPLRLDYEANAASQDLEKVEIDYESDSSDCRHEGYGVPCHAYNHAGCSKGRDCLYSHAVDHNSVRDDLGKNVCLYYLTDIPCKFKDECEYSHCRDYLPAGRWWDDEDKAYRVGTMILSDHPAREDPEILHHYLSYLDHRLVLKEKKFASMPEQLEQWVPRFKVLGDWMEEALGENPWSDSEDDWPEDYGSEDSGSPSRRGGYGRAAENDMARRGPHGFTDDEVEELLMQGVSPWDSDARAILDVLFC